MAEEKAPGKSPDFVAEPVAGESLPYGEIEDSFRRLYRIMERLQQPGGCPWDLEQTHESLKPYMIEEAYEAVEAIDEGDPSALEEELGDVLLQVVFHAVLAARTHGHFTMDSICRATAVKMVRRHPHVFGEAVARDAGEVLRRWEVLKAGERAAKVAEGKQASKAKGVLDGIPAHLPALLRAQRMQDKMERVHTDSNGIQRNSQDLGLRLETVLGLAGEAVETGVGTADDRRSEFGGLLWEIAAMARSRGLDAEDALRQECTRRAGDFVPGEI